MAYLFKQDFLFRDVPLFCHIPVTHEFPSLVLYAFTVLFLKATFKCSRSLSRMLLFLALCLMVTLVIRASAWSRWCAAR